MFLSHDQVNTADTKQVLDDLLKVVVIVGPGSFRQTERFGTLFTSGNGSWTG